MSGDEEVWKEKIKETYREWKSNAAHRSIKTYFNDVQKRPEGKQYSQGSVKHVTSIAELYDLIKEKELNSEEKVIIKGENKQIKFLGKEIEVEDPDDESVETYAKETLFGGFWKTMKKLKNSTYLKKKSIGDVIKKLLKKLVDFFEAGLQSVVIAIGYTIGKIVSSANPLPDTEPHEIGVEHIKNLNFVNYGETVENVPHLTFFPKTVNQIQEVIRYARGEGKRVRCAGMKHSWSQMYSDTGEILVFLLPLTITDTITFARSGLNNLEETLKEWNSDLSSIEVVEELEDGHAAVRVGAATTNLEMLSWSNSSGWTLPLDIIAVMITYGGSNAMICHGGGLRTTTLSDLVLKIEFVNADGELKTEDRPEYLKGVAGCFGLAGIVTHVTLKMDAMTYARFQPKKTLMRESIPRPGTDPQSPNFQKMVSLCEESYYTEFFWFPSHGEEDGYWENCWNNDGSKEDAIDINESLADTYQITSTFLFEVIMKVLQPMTLMTKEEHYDGKTSFEEALKYLFTKTVSMTGHNALPEPEEPLTTSLVEALHFRRGFHYIAVREMEMEIPIPSLEDGSPDWSIVSKAWWDAVDLIEESEKEGIFAVDMALELRIMGGSDILMASQYGNKHGTLAIEPVSTRIVHKEIWEDFKVKLAKVWMSYRDHDGSLLNTRIHWAKESPKTLEIEGKEYPTIEYWHTIYKDNMEQFFKILSEYNDLKTMHKTFSNQYLDQVFKPEWERIGITIGPYVQTNGHANGDLGSSESSSCCTIT